MSMHTMLGERIFANAANENMPLLGVNFFGRYDENFNDVFLELSSIEEIRDIAQKANTWVKELTDEILRYDFKIVGVTTGHQQTNAAISIINRIKAVKPDIICTMGGSACDGDMAEGIKTLCSNVDYIFSGESERSWREFLSDFRSDKMPERGVIRGEFLTDLNEIHCGKNTYYDYYNQLNILQILKEDETAFLYESSRGCWWGERHKCTFCGVNGWNKHYRYKTEDKVLSELTEMLESHPNVKQIQMVDTLMPRNYFNKLLFTLKKNYPGISVFYEQRADLNFKHVMKLKMAGVNYTQVGIEALSTNLLRLVNKGVDAEQNIKFLRYAKSVGLLIGWNLLTEIPNDSADDWKEFLDMVPL
ncbi:RiPP maturation radical SAM C-methyltransferase [Butyrivibrio sp. M55]|uniref:RiPP maturation radical SAM C-methyltransferase n=1 Tax=Butyrivibrio sp. M55 TaxID=1855323 RepID=UPI0008E463C1|nr:RiPP maturation radical SAM C-methyltransferase [Butyrivibrio sp. M55]SFU93779.1 magnesium-protoporphyrin IX monomethyl ester (oxidative) cyclase [Butyrivibrio sp. M55]